MSEAGSLSLLKADENDPGAFLAEWFERYVNRYRDKQGALPAAMELKYRHSRRVAENARLIAQSLEWNPAEILLAEGCGLIHDIGRFSQFVRYGSFHDAETMDHGMEGHRILQTEQLRTHFDADDWNCLLCAVEYHNKKVSDISDHFPGKADSLLRLIRDADKLDIMDLVLKSIAGNGFRELPDMLPHIRLDRNVSPGIMEEILNTRTVSVSRLRTVTDFVVMLASWFYDMNYAPTRKLAENRLLLQRIKEALPDTEGMRNMLDDIENIGSSTGGNSIRKGTVS